MAPVITCLTNVTHMREDAIFSVAFARIKVITYLHPVVIFAWSAVSVLFGRVDELRVFQHLILRWFDA